MTYFLYILSSRSADKFYVGIFSNPSTRLIYHNTIEKGFTARYRPWEIAYVKEYPSKAIARQKELKLKKLKSKIITQKLINGEIEL